MPELDLPDLHLPEAGIYLAAVMFWPRNPEKHQPLLESVRNTAYRNVIGRYGTAKIPEHARLDALNAAMGRSLQDEARDAGGHLMGGGYPRDMMAGLILTYVLSCAEAGDDSEPATLEHARSVIGTAGGSRASVPGRGRSYLIECWDDFSPSAHLSAIRLLMPDLWRDAGRRGGRDLALFLAYAEALRKQGESHRAPRAKSTLLEPAETWTVPARIILPNIAPQPLPSPAALKAELAAPAAAPRDMSK